MEKSSREFLGRWKSGRTWKQPTTARASKKKVTVGVLGHSWEEKLAQRQQAAMEKAKLEDLKKAREAKKARANLERANARKRREEALARAPISNTHQVISSSKKLKRMSKKQLSNLIKQ